MGSTTTRKPAGMSAIDFLRTEYHGIEDAAKVGGAVYAVYKITDGAQPAWLKPCADGAYRIGLTILVSCRGGNITWKDMDEGMGPNESRCPPALLAKLSPIERPSEDKPFNAAQWAWEWRNRCRANAGLPMEA